MMHQEIGRPQRVREVTKAPAEAIHVIAYRSLSVSRPTDADNQNLLRAAQARNKAEGLSGVLVYEQGAYFQWLEGPARPLARVWSSIQRDPRHHRIEVLRDERIDERVFEGWDLKIATGSRAGIEAAIAAMESSGHRLKDTLEKSKNVFELSLDDLFETVVIPRLCRVHGRDVRMSTRGLDAPALWHAALDSGMRLANVLMRPDGHDAARYVDSLLDEGANLNALYREVFEPAQLHLGKLWDDDQCDDFRLSVALTRMQLELMRVHAAIPAEHSCRPGLSVLLSPQPTEHHRVGLVMSSEVFTRSGWEVLCQIPADDQGLGDLVHGHWFDVLKLSQSGSLRRDSRLPAMRATIDSARAASLNPALMVLVDGRTFSESPQIYRSVHANAMTSSVLQAPPLAERLLESTRSVTALCQRSSA